MGEVWVTSALTCSQSYSNGVLAKHCKVASELEAWASMAEKSCPFELAKQFGFSSLA